MRYISNHVRFAIVDDVNYDEGIVRIRWLDNAAEPGQDIPIPHPFAGRGEGIYVGIRPGTLIAVDMTSYERYVPVAILPMRGMYASDLGNLDEARFDDISYPSIDEGEIVVQGRTGSQLEFRLDGSAKLHNQFGEGISLGGDSDSAHRCMISIASPVSYSISQSGLAAFGIVRRDARPDEGDFDTALLDPLYDLDYEQILEEIGRDPSKDVTYGTRKPSVSQSGSFGDQFRNPPFVEKRHVLYEFGREWLVDIESEEEALMLTDAVAVRAPDDRRERRTNVLSLSALYPNELMEEVEGTLVDVFGNVLDLNRSVIAPPTGKNAKEVLASAIENARHSVVFHKEINSRKGWGYRKSDKPVLPGLPDAASSANGARDRSRWAVDIDKEGLTKINIPATSETGNVPLLARFENSSSVKVDSKGNAKKESRSPEEAKRLYRSDPDKGQPRRDIFLDQVGPGDIEVIQRQSSTQSGTQNTSVSNRLAGQKGPYVEGAPSTQGSTIGAGTAFHAVTKTAYALLQETINSNSVDILLDSPPTPAPGGDAVSSKILRAVPSGSEGSLVRDDAGRPTNYPNAGGRSLNVSMDGSLTASIGADTVDRLSWIMDTAGGVVMRLGRDREGRSAVIHTDGEIALEVGGFDFIGSRSSDAVDTRFVGGGVSRATGLKKDAREFRAGKVVIRVRRSNLLGTGPDLQGDGQVIIIDDKGMTLDVSGQLTLNASQTLTLKSASKIVIDTEVIQLYKDDSKRLVIKNGKPII